MTSEAVEVTERSAAPVRRTGGRWNLLWRRIGFYALAAWSAVTLNFLIPRLMPGSPADAIIGSLQRSSGGQLSAEAVRAIRRVFGAPDQSLPVQYKDYLVQLVHLDLGISTSNYPVPVSALIGHALPWTLMLMGSATVLAFLIGTGAGVLSGWRVGGRLDGFLSPLSTFLSAVPYFWVALFALWLFGFKLGWFPLAGGYDPDVGLSANPATWLSALHYGFLPAATIVISSCGIWLLGMRNMMIMASLEGYVLLAKAKGLSPSRIIFGYAARNALLPQFTSFALALGTILGGSILTEVVFTYPGIGHLLYRGIINRDYPLMQGVLLVTTLGILVANFIVDSIYTLLDPRTREGDA